MREDEVANVVETTYSKMVGDFVNDAKELIETSWDWSALKTTTTIPTVADTHVYSIVGSSDKYKDFFFVNDTSNSFLEYRPKSWFEEKYNILVPLSGKPQYYTFAGLDANGDTQIDVYPNPDGVYSIRATGVIRNAPLVDNTDKLLIPHAPVMHLAIALLTRERGETGGTSTAEYFAIADKFLSDAISLDAQKHPDELIWYTP